MNPVARQTGVCLLWRLIAYVLLVMAVTGALVYPIYLVLELVGLQEVRFHKLVTRTLQVIALLGLWPLLASLGLNHRAGWGWAVFRPTFLRHFLSGFAVGCVMLALLVGVLLMLRVRVIDVGQELGLGPLLAVIVMGLIAGILVALAEETWFRGALFSAMLESTNVVTAVLVTAVSYAAVHFIRADIAVPPAELSWVSGFAVISGSFSRFGSFVIVDSMLALTMAGVFLCMLRSHTGSIAACVGVHAGWVLVIKVTKYLSNVNHDSQWAFLIGRYDGVIGMLGFAWLSICCVVYYWVLLRRR